METAPSTDTEERSADGGLILQVGSGGRRYREYLVAGAAARRRLWLLDAVEPSWQAGYLAGSTVVPLLDRDRLVPDTDGLIQAAEKLAAEHRIAGVYTYDETLVVATAHIAEALGLPGLSVAGAENCRNKHRTRTELTRAGLLQPRVALVTEAAEARAFAEETGYPLVLKPRGMGASMGVVLASGPGDIDAAFETAEASSHGGNPDYEGGVLVEEYLDGPEISIDGAVHRGEYAPFCLARKQVGLEPYFEETGHVVDARDPLLADAGLQEMLAAAHRALGIRDGITHTEVKLTSRGPAIVEVNARLGGDLIPYLGKLATGVDPAAVAVDLAAGRAPDLAPSLDRCAGIAFGYPPHDGVVLEVGLPAAGDAEGLVECGAMAEPGAVLRLPPRGFIARYAFVVCEGDGADRCASALESALALTSVALGPIAEDAGRAAS